MSRLFARFSLPVILVSAIITLFVMDHFLLVTRAAKARAVVCGGGKGRPTATTARNAMASFTIARGSHAGRALLSPSTLVTYRPFFVCSRGGGAGGGRGDREEDTPVIQPFEAHALNTPGVRQG